MSLTSPRTAQEMYDYAERHGLISQVSKSWSLKHFGMVADSLGPDQFDCIDYWAVADMTNGEEQKVVAFTVNSEVIKEIAGRYKNCAADCSVRRICRPLSAALESRCAYEKQ